MGPDLELDAVIEAEVDRWIEEKHREEEAASCE